MPNRRLKICTTARYGNCTHTNDRWCRHELCPNDQNCNMWNTSCKKGHTKRGLCPNDQKGLCKSYNRCVYTHERCSKPIMCKNPECKKGHSDENPFHSDKKEEKKEKSPKQQNLSKLLKFIHEHNKLFPNLANELIDDEKNKFLEMKLIDVLNTSDNSNILLNKLKSMDEEIERMSMVKKLDELFVYHNNYKTIL